MAKNASRGAGAAGTGTLITILSLSALFTAGVASQGCNFDVIPIGGGGEEFNGVGGGPACVPDPESCDGLDNDCDGDIDNSATCPDPTQACVNGVCTAAFGADPT